MAQQAQTWQKEDIMAGLSQARPLHLILAMVHRKDPYAFLEPLLPYVHSITVTKIEGEKSSYSPQALFDRIEPLNIQNLHQAETIEDALQNVVAQYPSAPARILMTGSLYFIGNILSNP